MASRTTPTCPSAGSGPTGRLLEIGRDDLAFDAEETEALAAACRAPAEPRPGAGARRADGGVGGGDLPRGACPGAARVRAPSEQATCPVATATSRSTCDPSCEPILDDRTSRCSRGRRSSTSSSRGSPRPSRACRTRRSGCGGSPTRTCSSARSPGRDAPTATTTCCATTSRPSSSAASPGPGRSSTAAPRPGTRTPDARSSRSSTRSRAATPTPPRSWSRRRRCGPTSSVTATGSTGGSAAFDDAAFERRPSLAVGAALVHALSGQAGGGRSHGGHRRALDVRRGARQRVGVLRVGAGDAAGGHGPPRTGRRPRERRRSPSRPRGPAARGGPWRSRRSR